MTDRDQDAAPDDHPRPWSGVKSKSGIALKDANGATVLLIPFTGVSSRPRKLLTADMILQAVNRPPCSGRDGALAPTPAANGRARPFAR